jgi:hypothetical protein
MIDERMEFFPGHVCFVGKGEDDFSESPIDDDAVFEGYDALGIGCG